MIPSRKKIRPASRTFEATRLVRKYALQIVQAAGGHPIVDLACGSGRNAIFLAQFDCTVICVDKDLSRLPGDKELNVLLIKHRLDLIADPWPFGDATIGGIILVDFLHVPLLSLFAQCLVPGGLLLLETVSGRGANYRELPRTGELLGEVNRSFHIEFYKESLVGPRPLRRVCVKMLARRRA